MSRIDRQQHNFSQSESSARPALRNNVPERPTYFVGREEVVADLVASLTTPRAPDLAIAGPPGVGKTALATELAHHPAVLAHFPDGVYWISLGANPDVAYIQARWAAALGHDIGDEPDIERRRARINKVIDRRRMLIVLDDVWDLTPAYLLHSAGPNTVHVMTTRNHPMAVTFAGNKRAFAVGALDTAAAFTLLGALAPRATNARPAQAQVLAARVGGLPLAIGLLGGYLAEQPRSWFPEVDQAKLDELASPQDRLALAETRLEADVDQESVLDQVIHLHLDDLGQLAPQAAEALNCLGAFAPEPATFDQAAAMAVGACSADTLRLLAARSLLKAGIDDKLMLHPVVADYIAGHVPPAAVSRHQTHYWGMVTAAGKDWQIIDAIFDQISHAMPPRLDDPMRLVAWVQALGPYLRRRGITDAYLAWAQQALALARQVSDKVGEATMLNNIGGIYVDFGDNEEALRTYEQVIPLARNTGDVKTEATALNGIGSIYYERHAIEQALLYYDLALQLHRKAGDKVGECGVLSSIGWAYANQGNKEQAIQCWEQALPCWHQIGDTSSESATLDYIGLLSAALGKSQKAIQSYEQALALRRRSGDKAGEHDTLHRISGVYASLGDRENELRYLEQALLLNDTSGGAEVFFQLGFYCARRSDTERAIHYYQEALALTRPKGNKGREALMLKVIGVTYFKLERYEVAIEYYEQVLSIRRQLDDVSGVVTALNNLSYAYTKLGDFNAALEAFEQALALARDIREMETQVNSLNGIGLAYANLKEPDKALYYYGQALHMARIEGDLSGEVETLNKIGLVYADIDDMPTAITHYEQALQVLSQTGDQSDYAYTRYNIAVAAAALGDLERAEAELARVVAFDEAFHSLNLVRDQALLEAVRTRRQAKGSGWLMKLRRLTRLLP